MLGLNFEAFFARFFNKWTNDEKIRGVPTMITKIKAFFSEDLLLYVEELLELEDSKQLVLSVSFLLQGLNSLHSEVQSLWLLQHWP